MKILKNSDEDRISALPDSVIHRIFAFLDTKQVVETSLLSRRWRNLWVSNPYLNLQFHMFPPEYRHRFEGFVEGVLFCRDGSDVHNFNLQCSGKEVSETDEVGSWIKSVVRKNVQEVKLHKIEIPHWSLKSLVDQVKSLTLVSIIFQKEPLRDSLVLNSGVLENLVLDKCDYNNHKWLVINAPNLKYLMINVDLDEVDDEDEDDYVEDKGIDSCHFKICAQNLTVLHIKGFMFKDYSLENLSALVTAKIDLYSLPAEEKRARCLKNILKGLTNAKSLTLSASTFQVFPEVPNTLNRMTIFENLRYLKLTEWCTTGYICVIVKLLEKFPYVETLVVKRTEVVLEPETGGGNWGAQLLSPCRLCHLRYIEIQNPKVSENEFKFLQFLMKNATGLENIVLTATNTQSAVRKKLVKFRKKLQEVGLAMDVCQTSSGPKRFSPIQIRVQTR